MVRKLVLTLAVVSLGSILAVAQEPSKVDMFAGYQYLHASSGVSGVDTKFYPFLFGPTLRVPNATHITPFGHALFGGGHGSAGALGFNFSETDFTWAAGADLIST